MWFEGGELRVPEEDLPFLLQPSQSSDPLRQALASSSVRAKELMVTERPL